ncbi:MAG: DNA translocase FtsK 4TM domain-containing protein [Alphaproteobacteria bacterium]
MTRRRAPTLKTSFFPEAAHSLAARTLRFTLGLVLCGFAIAIPLSCFSYRTTDPSWNTATAAAPENWLGLFGAFTADFFFQLFGLGTIILVGAMALLGARILRAPQKPLRLLPILSTTCIILVWVCLYGGFWPNPDFWPLFSGLGGASGDLLAMRVLWLTGISPTTLVYAGFVPTALLLGLVLWKSLGLTFSALLKIIMRHKEPAEDLMAVVKRTVPQQQNIIKNVIKDVQVAPEPITDISDIQEEQAESFFEDLPDMANYESMGAQDEFYLPPLELLEKVKVGPTVTIKKEVVDALAQQLKMVLEEFGIRGEITDALPGPVVTLYELKPAAGVKTSRVVGLADDIARSMSAVSARVAVVPGRNVIGIELPNPGRETVYLRELLQSQAYKETEASLPLILGKNIAGNPIVADLARMPHLLVAGTTGSGKSVAVNTMILSLLYRLTPESCRFIMIDPKMLELSIYDGIPHLLTPVVTDPKKAVVTLKWTVKEMENRYRLMAKLGVRNIDGYNARLRESKSSGELLVRRVQTGFDPDSGKPIFENQTLATDLLPMIVVVVDEMADLMMVAGKEIEGAVQRLAQMARASGIHLIMATQRPSVDVITGTIKSNFPTRISFQVSSKIDSRTILGEQGAEQLLGQGDMLYMQGAGRITRVHGAFCRDTDVERVVQFLRKQGEPSYLDEVTADPDDDGGLEQNEEQDALYQQAVDIVMREGKASTSFVQRHLQIGYNRAARIIEIMEKRGVVSPANHVGKREILGRAS